ncbi:MAG: hypothetical protein JXX14_09500 [Deltaproteobacteria bacterium]|nr:hypothetical protein [Deltaproteobacteria bacterium]
MKLIIGFIVLLCLGCGEDLGNPNTGQETGTATEDSEDRGMDTATDDGSDTETVIGGNPDTGTVVDDGSDTETGGGAENGTESEREGDGADSDSDDASDTASETFRFERELAELAAQQEKWAESQPASYQYEMANLCFCPHLYSGPFKVTVTDHQIIEVLIGEWGDEILETAGNWLPADLSEDAMVQIDHGIEALFEEIKSVLESNPDHATVTYDPTWGFPREIDVDPYEDWIDDEYTTTIYRFTVLQ